MTRSQPHQVVASLHKKMYKHLFSSIMDKKIIFLYLTVTKHRIVLYLRYKHRIVHFLRYKHRIVLYLRYKCGIPIPPSTGRIAIFASSINSPLLQCYRDRETRENLVPCSRSPTRHTAIFRMSRTWGEMKQDACSSCTSIPPWIRTGQNWERFGTRMVEV